MSDPGNYRSKEEVNHVKNNSDPIESLKKLIITKQYATEDELKTIDKEIREEINIAVEFCKASDEPDASELYTDIYKES
jgi:pyruvate dehydrogenase E1 component alpha subunit